MFSGDDFYIFTEAVVGLYRSKVIVAVYTSTKDKKSRSHNGYTEQGRGNRILFICSGIE